MHSYLIRVGGEVVERPQFLYMRVAIAIHADNIPAVIATYNALSQQHYTHASPVLFNAGTKNKNFASCFLYQPNIEKAAPLDFLGTAHDLDRLWLNDGGIGTALCGVPCKR